MLLGARRPNKRLQLTAAGGSVLPTWLVVGPGVRSVLAWFARGRS